MLRQLRPLMIPGFPPGPGSPTPATPGHYGENFGPGISSHITVSQVH
jgi:hypothetical protein